MQDLIDLVTEIRLCKGLTRLWSQEWQYERFMGKLSPSIFRTHFITVRWDRFMIPVTEIPTCNSIQSQRTWLLINQLRKGKLQSSAGPISGNNLFKNKTQRLVCEHRDISHHRTTQLLPQQVPAVHCCKSPSPSPTDTVLNCDTALNCDTIFHHSRCPISSFKPQELDVFFQGSLHLQNFPGKPQFALTSGRNRF